MDEDASDVPAPLKPHVPPGVSTVDGLVDAVAPAGRLPVLRFAGADPDQVRVRLVEGHVADGARGLVVEDRRPRGAVILGLPDAARARADVEDLRLRLHHGEVGDAPAHERGPEFAILQVRDGGLERGLGVGVSGCEHGSDQRDEHGRGA